MGSQTKQGDSPEIRDDKAGFSPTESLMIVSGSISSRCVSAENPSTPVRLLQPRAARASWGEVGKAANTPNSKRVCTCNGRAYCQLVSETEDVDALSINWLLVPPYANCNSDLHAK